MRLLVVTQVVDTEDPVLGFFVSWLVAFSGRFEAVHVICLRTGEYQLPNNVYVHSLGKERALSHRVVYVARFLRFTWRLRHEYDAVFVHMNQEYVLAAGWLWRVLGKPVYLWRNHYAGTWRTDLAAQFCTKIFCTSRYSYTAKYGKTVFMPVGIDTMRFRVDGAVTRKPRSVMYLARIAPSKRVEMFIDALGRLHHDGIQFTATIVGSPQPADAAYYDALQIQVRTLGIDSFVQFLPAVPPSATPDLYRAHELFVNTSPSGMLDKTIFEAAACGCRVLASSKDFAMAAGDESFFDSAETLAERLVVALESSGSTSLALVEQQSLRELVEQIARQVRTSP